MRYNESVQLLQSNGKAGASIVKFRYEKIKKVMIMIIREAGIISFEELSNRTMRRLTPFDGNNQWYMEAIVTDLEARGQLECPMLNGQLFVKFADKRHSSKGKPILVKDGLFCVAFYNFITTSQVDLFGNFIVRPSSYFLEKTPSAILFII